MPGGKVGGEEEGGERDGDRQRLARAMHRLAEHPREQPQEGKRQRQPPEAGRDRPDAAVADEERPGGQREIADQQREEGEAFDFAFARQSLDCFAPLAMTVETSKLVIARSEATKQSMIATGRTV